MKTKWFIDYLLLDDKSNPLIVLEAKRRYKSFNCQRTNRKYANSLRAKYIILSNGETHFGICQGNPEIITAFPTYESLIESKALNSTTNVLVNMNVDKYFIALSQDPSLENNIVWKLQDEDEIDKYCKKKEIRILRYYQLNAIKSVQEAVSNKKNRFLFEWQQVQVKH